LNDVSLEIRDDELLAVIGPNGAGKSSLMNCLSGFYRPRRAHRTPEATSRHMPVHEIARAGVARTFQGTHIFSGMTVIENLMVGATSTCARLMQSFVYFPRTQREEVQHREFVEEIIEFLEIEVHTPPAQVGSLGYGLRKRVDLGRALAQDPSILLMDEPMAGMNTEEKEDLARFILDVREARRRFRSCWSSTTWAWSWIWPTGSPCSTSGARSPVGTPSKCRRSGGPQGLPGGRRFAMMSSDEDTLPQHPSSGPAEPHRLSQRHKGIVGIWREYSFQRVRPGAQIALGLHGMGVVARARRSRSSARTSPSISGPKFAAQALGCKVVSMYPDLTADEVQYLLDGQRGRLPVRAGPGAGRQGAGVLQAQLPGCCAIVYWDDTGMWSYQQPSRCAPFEAVQELGARIDREPERFDRARRRRNTGRHRRAVVHLGHHRQAQGRDPHAPLPDRQRASPGQCDRCTPGMEYLSYIAPAWATEQFFGITHGAAALPLVVNFPEGPEQVLRTSANSRSRS
jgi:ABC-type branched-subunit amino acid transport system ATPase component